MPLAPLALTIPSPDGNAWALPLDSTTRQLVYWLSSAADGSWYFRGVVPTDYASAAAIVVVAIANATTGAHVIGVDVFVAKDGEDQDPTPTALSTQTVTVPATAYQQDRITFSSGLPTLEPGDVIQGRVWRDADAGGDTLAVDTGLVAAVLSYTA